MKLHQVQYFLAVAEERNATRAAKRCGVSQPALTRAIQKLEFELGAPLFRRERARTHLTELGRILRPQFEKMIDISETIDHSARAWHNREQAALRLGVMCTVPTPEMVPILDGLHRDIPNLELDLHDAGAEETLEQLENGDVDAAILALPTYPDRVELIPLFDERYVVAFAPGHPFESQEEIAVGDLRGQDYLYRTNCESAAFFRHHGINIEDYLNVKFASQREDWVQAMVLAGYGCAIMPEQMIKQSGVLTRPITSPAMRRTISLAYMAGRRFSPAMKRLVDLCRRMARN